MIDISFPLYTLVLIAMSLLFIGMGLVAVSRQTTTSSLPFALLMLTTSLWLFGCAMEGASIEMPVKIFWAKFQYLGIPWTPLLWMVLSLSFTNQKYWLTRRNLALFSIPPAITMLLAFTNEYHHLIWSAIKISPGTNNQILLYTHGFGLWVMITYSYLLVIIGLIWMLQAVLRYPDLYRRQATALFAGAAIPIIGNLIYMAGLSPVKGLDITPFGFVFSGILFAWTIFRYQLFQLVPVARESLIEQMPDGVLVVDKLGQIADINPTAKKIAQGSLARLGEPVKQVFPFLLPFVDKQKTQAEICIDLHSPVYLDVNITPIYNQDSLDGKLIVMRDITERKQIERSSHQLAEEAGIMAERQRLSQDLHDLVTQNMYSLMLFADSGQDYARDQQWSQVTGCLEDINHIAKQVLRELRLLLFDLRPTTFESVGLVEALEERLETVEQRAGIATCLMAEDNVVIPENLQPILYRIVVEALNNSLKHSRAKHVSIQIMMDHQNLTLEIKDDGHGFEPVSACERGGMGLKNMRERTEKLGGILKITSQPGQGATVYICLPFPVTTSPV